MPKKFQRQPTKETMPVEGGQLKVERTPETNVNVQLANQTWNNISVSTEDTEALRGSDRRRIRPKH